VIERARMADCVGEWSGINRLWLEPGDPVRESETAASVALSAGGAIATIRYTWDVDGEAADGILLVRIDSGPSPLDMVWADSWHTGGRFMVFRGESAPDGSLSALGSYPAPEGPDWGWRIVLAAAPPAAIRLVMHNISPDGNEALAVEANYVCADAGQGADAAGGHAPAPSRGALD
jgi:hypothetical protein